jgi:hypothetical protein
MEDRLHVLRAPILILVSDPRLRSDRRLSLRPIRVTRRFRLCRFDGCGVDLTRKLVIHPPFGDERVRLGLKLRLRLKLRLGLRLGLWLWFWLWLTLRLRLRLRLIICFGGDGLTIRFVLKIPASILVGRSRLGHRRIERCRRSVRGAMQTCILRGRDVFGRRNCVRLIDRRQRFTMFGLDIIDGGLKLVHLPAKHFLRRARLHVLELPLNSAASLLIHFRACLRRVGRQTVNSTADHRYKISHQHFLMVAGSAPAEWIINS